VLCRRRRDHGEQAAQQDRHCKWFAAAHYCIFFEL
jgi:hypothetical protein